MYFYDTCIRHLINWSSTPAQLGITFFAAVKTSDVDIDNIDNFVLM